MSQALSHGEFELTSEFQDVFRALYAQMGLVLPYLLVVWTFAVSSALGALFTGTEPTAWSSIVAMLGAFSVVMLVLSAMRTRKSPPWTVRITDESISASRPAGEVKLNWAALTRVDDRAGMLILYAGRMIVALPLYRMSEVQVATVRARLEANGAKQNAKLRGAKSRRRCTSAPRCSPSPR